MKESISRLIIDQSNVFYNYTIGLKKTDVDLLKTARKLLDSGLISAVRFSDLKCLYLDQKDEIQFEWVHLDGRYWDKNRKVNIDQNIPQEVAIDLALSIELLFHEQQIEGLENQKIVPHLRAALPPIFL